MKTILMNDDQIRAKRAKILKQAEKLGCLNEVLNLSNIQAIRCIQRKEGNTPCFARDVPLSFLGRDPLNCRIWHCSWLEECNEFRVPHPLSRVSGKATRNQIIEQADRYDCVQDILNLSEVDAIRYIQQKGGYTPCYARDVPLIPNSENPKFCSRLECYWINSCDGYRSKELIPIDKELPTLSHNTIELLRTRLLDFHNNLVFPSEEVVGLKLKSFQNLFSASRKMLLACPKTVVGESTEDSSTLKPYFLKDNSDIVGTSGDMFMRYSFQVLFTNDIGQLNQWLSETQLFIENDNLSYFPLIKNFTHTETVSSKANMARSYWQFPSFYQLMESKEYETFQAPHLGAPDGDIMLSASEFAPILKIDLPVLENINFNTLFNLMSDFPEELSSFRDFLHSEVEEMRQAAVGSNQFSKEVRRIEREIRDHIRKLNSDYKKAKLEAAFSLTGCVIASWTLALYCFLQGTDNILSVLGPGGVAYTASAAYSDYLVKRLELKEDPVYFLWILGNTKRKT